VDTQKILCEFSVEEVLGAIDCRLQLVLQVATDIIHPSGSLTKLREIEAGADFHATVTTCGTITFGIMLFRATTANDVIDRSRIDLCFTNSGKEQDGLGT
jgi:hypothetical protein